jgi:hypothetical protein
MQCLSPSCHFTTNTTVFDGATLGSNSPATAMIACTVCIKRISVLLTLLYYMLLVRAYTHTYRGLAQSALRSFRTVSATATTGTTTATTLSQQQQHAAKLFAVPLVYSIPAQTRSRLTEPLCWELHLCSSSGVLSQSHLLCDGQSLLGFAQHRTDSNDSSSSSSSKDQQDVAVLPQELVRRLQMAAEGSTAGITEVYQCTNLIILVQHILQWCVALVAYLYHMSYRGVSLKSRQVIMIWLIVIPSVVL